MDKKFANYQEYVRDVIKRRLLPRGATLQVCITLDEPWAEKRLILIALWSFLEAWGGIIPEAIKVSSNCIAKGEVLPTRIEVLYAAGKEQLSDGKSLSIDFGDKILSLDGLPISIPVFIVADNNRSVCVEYKVQFG